MGKVKLRQVIYFICIRLIETSTASDIHKPIKVAYLL